jgi:hypothetical protein
MQQYFLNVGHAIQTMRTKHDQNYLCSKALENRVSVSDALCEVPRNVKAHLVKIHNDHISYHII